MKHGVVICFCAVMLCIIPLSADILMEGMKNYEYQYKIANISNNSEYTFITSSAIWGFDHPGLIVNGSFGGGYKLDGFEIHAIPSDSLNASLRSSLNASSGAEDLNLSANLQTIPMVTANMTLQVGTSLKESLNVNNVTFYLNLDSVNSTALIVTPDKVVYGYQNGTIQELPVTDINYVPEPGSHPA